MFFFPYYHNRTCDIDDLFSVCVRGSLLVIKTKIFPIRRVKVLHIAAKNAIIANNFLNA